MNLLLVDEDQHFARILGTVLENDGHTVFATADAAGALAMYSAQSPDILLISGDLHRNAGLALLREIRRRPGGDKPVAVVLVQHATTEVRRECDELEVGHVLTRPFSVLDLASLIRAVEETRVAPATAAAQARVDIHNLQQLVRWWARQSTGVLQVRGERAEGTWITMAKGGPLGAEAFVRLRAALYGGELDFQSCDVDGVGDRAGLAIMLWEAALASETGRDDAPTRAMMAARTRITDVASELPAPLAVRRMCELLDAPTSIGSLCDQVGAEVGEVAGPIATLVAMGMLSVQGRASVGSGLGGSRQATPSNPPRSVPPGRVHSNPPRAIPPPAAISDSPRSVPPPRRVGDFIPSRNRADDVTVLPRERAIPPRAETPWSEPARPASPRTEPPRSEPSRSDLQRTEPIRSTVGDRISRSPPSQASERPWSQSPPDRPFAAEGSVSRPRTPEPPEYSRAPESRGRTEPPAADAAALRRARRDVDVLRGSDAWVVLGVPRDAPRDLVERAAARMLARYETLTNESEGEMRDLARQLLALVQKAAEELAQTHAVAAQKEQPGDDAFRAGVRAMADGDWSNADRRFAHARDQNLDSPRNLAHLGWARFHNPDIANADRVQDGLDLLRLAEQLDPNYPDGQYFLAVVLHRKGDDEAALRRLRRALKAEPGHVAANALARKLRRPTPPT